MVIPELWVQEKKKTVLGIVVPNQRNKKIILFRASSRKIDMTNLMIRVTKRLHLIFVIIVIFILFNSQFLNDFCNVNLKPRQLNLI